MRTKINSKINVLHLILFLIGLSTPIGAGLSDLLEVDVSKLFLVIVVLLGLLTIFHGKFLLNMYPNAYLAYLGFIVLHTIFFGFIFFPRELFLVSESGEAKIIGIIRFFFMIIFSLLLIQNTTNKKQIKYLLYGYIIGYIISFATGLFFLYKFIGTENFRLSAGFQNPNSFGISSVVYLFITIYLFLNTKKKSLLIWGFMLFIGLAGIVLSESRSAIVGPIVGFLIISIKNINKKRVIIVGLGVIFILTISYIAIVPKEYKESISERFNISNRIELGHEERIFIWKDYIRNIHKYVLQGYGRGRITKITEGDYSSRINYVTHNKYLRNLAEFGIVGFLLFLLMLYQINKNILGSNKPIEEYLLSRIFFVCWVILMLLGDYSNSRDFWMSISLLIIISNIE